MLSWAASRPFDEAELDLLRRSPASPPRRLAALAARSTISVLLETYLGRRSAAQVLAGRLRREPGETIRAALLYADLRGFTELSEKAAPQDVVEALDAWFDRIAGAVHAFGGEVLKFIGDGVLAIFPIGERVAPAACDAALSAIAAARAGMDHLDRARSAKNLPPLPFGAALHVGEMLWGNIGTANRLISPPSAPPSIWSAGWKGSARRSTVRCCSPEPSPGKRRSLLPLGEHSCAASPSPARCSRQSSSAGAPFHA